MQEICRFNSSRDFNELLKATKDFVSKNDNRPVWQMIFLRGEKQAPDTISETMLLRSKLTALAIDGYRVSREICRNITVWEDFTGYIYIPRCRPSKDDTVIIYRDEDGTIVISYENSHGAIQFRNKQPVTKASHEDLYNQVSEYATDIRMGVNAVFLENAAMSLTTVKHMPVVISASLDPTKPLKLTQGDSIRIVLPVRLKSN